MSRPRRSLSLVALIVSAGVVLTLAPAGAATGSPQSGVRGRCASPLLAGPRRAAAVRAASPAKLVAAASRSGMSSARLAGLSRDRTLWLDRCGQPFYVDAAAPAQGGAAGTTANATGAGATLPAGVDPLALSSRPGSSRTIYLDFTGGTVTGTAWNKDYGTTIHVEPFSITDPVSTAFSQDEKNQIYRTWLVVAEDYAPFDVDVTTRDPGEAALDRSTSADQVYGTRVQVTNGGPIYDDCGCGGVSYIGVFDRPGPDHAFDQPAWVFADGTTHDGWSIGQAASHEAGHSFGLQHDGVQDSSGTTVQGYYEGTRLWAPIMGASYYSVLSQWSRGEYPGANNPEDDLQVISSHGAPLLPDDHGDTAATATPLRPGTPVAGVIGTPSDVDAFSFTAAGVTTLRVGSATPDTDLDTDLRVYDASGHLVADVNPPLGGSEAQHPVPSALGATWTATLPAAAATYTAVVGGSDNGNQPAGMPYGDYGSLGRYRITLSTPSPTTRTAPAPRLGIATTALPRARRARAYRAPVRASNAAGAVSWKITRGHLPRGLRLVPVRHSAAALIAGRPWRKGTFRFVVEVRSLNGARAARSLVIRIR